MRKVITLLVPVFFSSGAFAISTQTAPQSNALIHGVTRTVERGPIPNDDNGRGRTMADSGREVSPALQSGDGREVLRPFGGDGRDFFVQDESALDAISP